MTPKLYLTKNFYNCLIILFFLCSCSSLSPEEQLLADLSFLDNLPEVSEDISEVKTSEITQKTEIINHGAENTPVENFDISEEQDIALFIEPSGTESTMIFINVK